MNYVYLSIHDSNCVLVNPRNRPTIHARPIKPTSNRVRADQTLKQPVSGQVNSFLTVSFIKKKEKTSHLQNDETAFMKFMESKLRAFNCSIYIVSPQYLNCKVNCETIKSCNDLLSFAESDSELKELFNWRRENFQNRTGMFDNVYQMASTSSAPRQFQAANPQVVSKVIKKNEINRIKVMNKLHINHSVHD